ARYYLRRLVSFARNPLVEVKGVIGRRVKRLIEPTAGPVRGHSQAKPRWLDSPALFPGRIALLRTARQDYWRKRDLLKGWGRHTTEGVDAHIIPGNHLTMYREPHVRNLAQILTNCLASAAALLTRPT